MTNTAVTIRVSKPIPASRHPGARSRTAGRAGAPCAFGRAIVTSQSEGGRAPSWKVDPWQSLLPPSAYADLC